MRPLARLSAAAVALGLTLAVAVPAANAASTHAGTARPAAGQSAVTKATGYAHVRLTGTAASSTDDTSTDDTTTPKPPPSDKAANVEFWVGEQQLTEFTKVPAGSELKIKNVPGGANVLIYNFKDPAETFAATPTKKTSVWKSDALPPATRIQVVVTASDDSKKRINFSTQAAANTFDVTVSPDGGLWGTGMPLVVDFGVPIADKDKATVESALKVDSTVDIGEASWHWMSSSEIVFRPRDFWPGNAKITLSADLRRFEAGGGYWGPMVNSSFRTDDAIRMEVSLRKHTMDFYRGGKLVNQFPISGGMPGHETASGIKVIETKETNRWLTNPDPVNGWHVQVAYAMRVTDDAEFIHTATWNYNLGSYNTSHGCTNMSLSDSGWVYHNVNIGDPVVYTGSSVKVPTSNYLSGYWNYKWTDWKAGSALYKKK